jgi:ferrous iron transport protein B
MTTFALAGNPNTGKTSLFNALTGSYEYVGNWPGVTVEKKVGRMKAGDTDARIVDLPGVYSLIPLSGDEEVAIRCLLHDSVDAVINVVDASQLRRNLHLTIQLLETGLRVVVALNMVDVADRRGLGINEEKLSALLGVPVVPVIARTGLGCPELSARLATGGIPSTEWKLDYGDVLEEAIRRICAAVPDDAAVRYRETGRSVRWLALQCLEGNRVVQGELDQAVGDGALEAIVCDAETRLAANGSGQTPEKAIRKCRDAFLDLLIRECTEKHAGATGASLSGKLDRVVTDKWLGIPIFLLIMYAAFMFTFDWLGTPLSDWLDGLLSGPVTSGLEQWLASAGASAFITSLVLDGIVGGVGGVLVFVPQIFVLFLVLSLIEDSGYMARVALVMDRLAETIGITGKAFIPLVIGFGCNVPGVMAARTIERPKERLLTVLLTPLMSCPARLAVFSLFAAVFFPDHQAIVVLSLYGMGIVLAMGLAKVMSRFLSKGEPSTMVIELPPYHLPQWRSMRRKTWEKGKGFIVKAGTFIFGGSVLVWLLGSVNLGGVMVPMEESFLAQIGGLLAPLLEPLGFGTWQAAASLVTGFFAKEVVVSTMNIMYGSTGAGSLQDALAAAFTPVQAYGFMAFLLIYVPCLATVGTIRNETKSAVWTWFSVGYALVLAYVIALLIHVAGGWLFG